MRLPRRLPDPSTRSVYQILESVFVTRSSRLAKLRAAYAMSLSALKLTAQMEERVRQALSAEALVRCQMLEDELSRTKIEAENKEKALLAQSAEARDESCNLHSGSVVFACNVSIILLGLNFL
ncbi:hypothetical protein QQ045_001559 [Rhodiola kirilowii]